MPTIGEVMMCRFSSSLGTLAVCAFCVDEEAAADCATFVPAVLFSGVEATDVGDEVDGAFCEEEGVAAALGVP